MVRRRSLEDELVAAVSAETGLSAEEALRYVRPVLRHLSNMRGGARLYIRRESNKRDYPVDQIERFYRTMRSAKLTCQEFAISRSTLFRLMRRRRKRA